MELKEYIKQSYLRPNKQVLKSLGASDELIDYLKFTPWNTNWNIIVANYEDSEEDKITTLITFSKKEARKEVMGSISSLYDNLSPSELWNICNQYKNKLDKKLLIKIRIYSGGISGEQDCQYITYESEYNRFVFNVIADQRYQIRVYQNQAVCYYDAPY